MYIYFFVFWCVINLNNFPLRVCINLSAIAAFISLEETLYKVIPLEVTSLFTFSL